jgi:hypothetical protein
VPYFVTLPHFVFGVSWRFCVSWHRDDDRADERALVTSGGDDERAR